MSDLLVILGAGASHDALRPGKERPPLANDLFDEQYDDLHQQFPDVDGLRGRILAGMKQGRSLETILGQLTENLDPNIQRQMREVPFYLQRLLSRFSSERPGTYDTLITLIQEARLSVTFVTLNYDTMLEDAIVRKYDSAIESMDDYVDSSFTREWNCVKLHGSVDWGYKTSISLDVTYPGRLDALGRSLEQSTRTPEMLMRPGDTQLGGLLAYPALAVPKERTKNVVCPDTHVEVLRDALRSDPAVLVVGNQGLDADLMDILRDSGKPAASWWERDATDILRDAVGATSGKPLLVVDPGDTSEVAARFTRALHRSEFNYTGRSVRFREFVESEEAVRFFDDVAASAVRESVAPPQPQHR